MEASGVKVTWSCYHQILSSLGQCLCYVHTLHTLRVYTQYVRICVCIRTYIVCLHNIMFVYVMCLHSTRMYIVCLYTVYVCIRIFVCACLHVSVFGYLHCT